MTRKLSEGQKAKLRKAIQLVKEAQQHLDQVNQTIDEMMQEKPRHEPTA